MAITPRSQRYNVILLKADHYRHAAPIELQMWDMDGGLIPHLIGMVLGKMEPGDVRTLEIRRAS